jgi:hypothetical protein
MIKISRYILVFLGILVASIVIPKLYWIIFEKATNIPNIYYSCIKDDYFIVHSDKNGIEITDTKGKSYTMSEYEENLPLIFFRQLMFDGRMPDSINGVPMDPAALNKARSFITYRPKDYRSPQPVLNPLLESESGKVQLVMPDDYFRIDKRMEFIDAASNKVNFEKSERFTQALIKNNFAFPAKIIAGLPTVRKSCDDGYFVKDSRGDLFQIKMVKGEPFIVRIDVPDYIDIVHIECVDLKNREFYCYLFTRNSGIFVVLEGIYELQRLPIEGFNPMINEVKVNCDLFNKTISLIGDNYIHTVTVDEEYNVINSYDLTWPAKYERTDYKVFSSLFPFEIKMKIPESKYVNFYFIFSSGFLWIITNLIFVGLSVFLIYKKNTSLKYKIPDLIIILLTGVFGFIATQIFPLKIYN